MVVIVDAQKQCYRSGVNRKVITTELPSDEEFNARMQRFRLNGEWLTSHGAPFLDQFPGRYLAVSEGEVFVADDASQARTLAKAKHPEDEPFVQFVPYESRERTYAH